MKKILLKIALCLLAFLLPIVSAIICSQLPIDSNRIVLAFAAFLMLGIWGLSFLRIKLIKILPEELFDALLGSAVIGLLAVGAYLIF
ncbi:MAG: hypothetical protein PHE43_04070 [Candidatus Nanoarchaeia archaeon]|nr:hypothetical protein [Candidatus Nanoarchaeia archaeon]